MNGETRGHFLVVLMVQIIDDVHKKMAVMTAN